MNLNIFIKKLLFVLILASLINIAKSEDNIKNDQIN